MPNSTVMSQMLTVMMRHDVDPCPLLVRSQLCCTIRGQVQRLTSTAVGFGYHAAGAAYGSKEIGSEQIPKSTIAALGKMPGSEGNHGQTAKHRQYCMNVGRLGSTQL